MIAIKNFLNEAEATRGFSGVLYTDYLLSMPWKCLDCREVFQGPKDHTPKEGCPVFRSNNIIDINVSSYVPISPFFE